MSSNSLWYDTWYDITIASVFASAMIFVPFTVWQFLICADKKHEQAERKKNKNAIAELAAGLRDEIAAIRIRHPEPIETCSSNQIELDGVNRKWNRRITRAKKNAERRARGETVNCLRIYSAVFYVIFWICLIFLTIYVPVAIRFDSSLSLSLVIVAVIGLVIGTVWVCLESIFSRERRHLQNFEPAIFERVKTLRATPPVITFRAVSSHYEDDTRIVTGKYEEMFHFKYWKDESETTIDDISTDRMTRIKMDLVVKFADTDTETAFNEQYGAFKLRYRNADKLVTFTESRKVNGFKRRLIAYPDQKKKNWWIRGQLYWIATVLFLTWPYRLMIKCATEKSNYTLEKSVRCSSYPLSAGANPDQSFSRTTSTLFTISY